MKKLIFITLLIALFLTLLFPVTEVKKTEDLNMSFLADTETAITEKLQLSIPQIKSEAFPDKSDNYQLFHPKGAILVHYLGTTTPETKSTNIINQELTLHWGITILARGLRKIDGVTGEYGAYQIMEDIKKSLIGFKINGCSKIYLVKEGFISEESGVWTYQIIIAHKTNFLEEV